MSYILSGSGLIVAFSAVAYYWRRVVVRGRVTTRLDESVAEQALSLTNDQPFTKRHRFIPILFGVVIALALILLIGWPVNISIGIAFAVSLLGMELDAWIYETTLNRIENQLADTLDLVVASLSAGSSLQVSLAQAADYADKPLKTELSELVARLRLGDAPEDAFELLQKRVPTETFQLLTTSLIVNWQVGGGLAETLAGVGKTIRDRLAIARQIKTLSTQGRLTTLTVLSVVWFLAAMMWQSDPPQFVGFVNSEIGSRLFTATLILQGIGIALVSKISRPRI